MARSEQKVMYLRLGYSSFDFGVLADTDTSDTREQILSSHRIHRCKEGSEVTRANAYIRLFVIITPAAPTVGNS